MKKRIRTTTSTRSFLNRLRRSTTSQRTAVMLGVLVWSTLALGGEIDEAAKGGDLVKVQTVLQGDRDLVNHRDSNGTPVLNWAAVNGRKEIVECLLANKVDIRAKDAQGNTALHAAVANGHTEVAKLLVGSQLNVNATNDFGDTPLHHAAENGHKDTVEWLLANKAEVNPRDRFGRTPLRLAETGNPYSVAIGESTNVVRYKDVADLLRLHGGHK